MENSSGHYGIPNKIINMLKVQNQGFTCQVLHGGTMTEPIQVKTGARQACLLSPLLFLVVLDWVSKNAYGGKRLLGTPVITHPAPRTMLTIFAYLTH